MLLICRRVAKHEQTVAVTWERMQHLFVIKIIQIIQKQNYLLIKDRLPINRIESKGVFRGGHGGHAPNGPMATNNGY